MSLLQKIQQAGVRVALNNEGGLTVKSQSKLTQQQRQFIKANKPAIVNELKTAIPYLHWHVMTATDDAQLSVIPPSTLAEIKAKFPKAIIVEPVETMQ